MATDCAFRRCVEQMPHLLICFPQPGSDPSNRKDSGAAVRPRQPPFAVISKLIAIAAPGSDTWERRSRYRRSPKLWADPFTLPTFSESDAIALERVSRHWPVVHRKPFASAFLIRNRKRWPYNRSLSMAVCPGFKYGEAFVVHDLAAVGLLGN